MADDLFRTSSCYALILLALSNDSYSSTGRWRHLLGKSHKSKVNECWNNSRRPKNRMCVNLSAYLSRSYFQVYIDEEVQWSEKKKKREEEFGTIQEATRSFEILLLQIGCTIDADIRILFNLKQTNSHLDKKQRSTYITDEVLQVLIGDEVIVR